MITVIDLHIGNTASVSRALKYLDIPHLVSDDIGIIDAADRLIFPGVGNFFEASKILKTTGLYGLLRHKVLDRKTPILGICLGMQLFATFGEEGGRSEGLDFIKSNILYHRASGKGLRLPHIGWNEVRHEGLKVFDSIPDNTCFYFAHSYEMTLSEAVKAAYSDYGVNFVAVVQKGNIIGCQFHPEKSQKAGLKLLDNFCKGIM